MDASISCCDHAEDNASSYSLPFTNSPRPGPFSLSNDFFSKQRYRTSFTSDHPILPDSIAFEDCTDAYCKLATAPNSEAKNRIEERRDTSKTLLYVKGREFENIDPVFEIKIAHIFDDLNSSLNKSQCKYPQTPITQNSPIISNGKWVGKGLGLFKINNDVFKNSTIVSKKRNRQVKTIFLKNFNSLQKRQKAETPRVIEKIHKKRGRKPKNKNIDFVSNPRIGNNSLAGIFKASQIGVICGNNKSNLIESQTDNRILKRPSAGQQRVGFGDPTFSFSIRPSTITETRTCYQGASK